MRRAALVALLAVLSTACPKHVDTVAGSDDEQLDQDSSQMEQVRAQAQASEPACKDWCRLSKTVCGIARHGCDVAGRNPTRQDMQAKCASFQEDCTQYNDRCASCSR